MNNPMELMDLLFREYASPFVLLDAVIPAGQFVNFLDTFQRKHEEKTRWEFYLHKLSVWDQRSWEQFNHDLDFGTAEPEQPSDEEIAETVRTSFQILKNWKGGEEN